MHVFKLCNFADQTKVINSSMAQRVSVLKLKKTHSSMDWLFEGAFGLPYLLISKLKHF